MLFVGLDKITILQNNFFEKKKSYIYISIVIILKDHYSQGAKTLEA